MQVGEVVAYLRADDTQYSRTLDNAGKQWSGFTQTLRTGAGVVTGVLAAGTTATVGLGASLLRVGTSYNTLQQSSLAALKTMLGSTEAAQAQLEKFNDFARSSPFAKDVFLGAQQQLLAFGVEAEKVIPILNGVQNAVAAAGGTSADIGGLVEVFAKIKSSAKITGEDLMQFGNRGVDAATLIGNSMGKTSDEVRTMISKGEIDADTAIDAIVNGIDTKFGGAAANLKNTFIGAQDRIKGAWRDLGGHLAAPFVDPAGGGYLVTWFNDIADLIRVFEKNAAPVMDAIMNRWGYALDGVHPKLEELKESLRSWDSGQANMDLDHLLGTLREYGPVIGLVAGGMAGFSKDIPVLGKAVSALGLSFNPLLGAMAGLLLSTPEIRGEMGNLLSSLTPLLVAGSEVTRVFAEFASDALVKLVPELVNLAEAVVDAGTPILEMLIPAAETTVAVLGPIVDVAADVAHWLSELPSPILAGAAAFLLLEGRTAPLTAGLSTAGKAIKSFGENVAISAMVAKQDGFGTLTASFGGISGAAKKAGDAIKTAFINNAVGIAITALVTVLGVFAQKAQEAEARADAYRTVLSGVGKSATQTAEELRQVTKESLVLGENMDWGWVQKLNTGFDSAADAVESLGISLDDFADAVHGPQEKFDAMISSLEDMRAKNPELAATIQEVIIKLEQQREAANEAERQNAQLSGSNENVADSSQLVADTARDAADRLQKQADAARALRDNNMDVERTAISFEESMSKLSETLTANGTSLDINTEAGRNNRQAFLDSMDAANRHAEAMIKNGSTVEEVNAYLADARQRLLDQASAAGVSSEEVAALNDTMALTPHEIETLFKIRTQNAQADIDRFIRLNSGRVISIGVGTSMVGSGKGIVPGTMMANGAVLKFFGNGGHENHVAQHVPAGSWRVFGEPETEGETYIPHALSKRARSLQILGETAHMFGRKLVPIQATSFANGSPVAPSSPVASSVSYAFGDVLIRVEDLEGIRTVEEFVAHFEEWKGKGLI